LTLTVTLTNEIDDKSFDVAWNSSLRETFTSHSRENVTPVQHHCKLLSTSTVPNLSRGCVGEGTQDSDCTVAWN